jgi:hypothetical protein
MKVNFESGTVFKTQEQVIAAILQHPRFSKGYHNISIKIS